MTESVFARWIPAAWPMRFEGQLVVRDIAGGIPNTAKAMEGHIRSKVQTDNSEAIKVAVIEAMLERGATEVDAGQVEDAIETVVEGNTNGFRRDDNGLYIGGYQLKAAIKEAANVAYASGKLTGNMSNGKGWGRTGKGLMGFVAEHIQVVEDRLYLGVDEPSGVAETFIHASAGGKKITAIQRTEYVTEAKVDFTVICDWEFTDEQWAIIWLTGEQQGLGAGRPRGNGRYTVTKWDRV